MGTPTEELEQLVDGIYGHWLTKDELRSAITSYSKALEADARRWRFVLLHTWISDGQRLHIAFEHKYDEAYQGITQAVVDRAIGDAALAANQPTAPGSTPPGTRP